MNVDGDPRIPFVGDRRDVPEESREHFDSIVDSRGSIRGPFGVLLNSPDLAGRVGHLGHYVRFESVLDGDHRELAILTIAREFRCAFEWAAHEPIAREEGVTDDVLDVVIERRPVDELEGAEACIVRYGRELFDEKRVSDETFEDARERFGVRGVTDLTGTMGYYSLIACVLNAFEVRPDVETPVG